VRTPVARVAQALTSSLCLLSASAASAHELNNKEKIYFIDSPWVERAWTEGDFRVGVDIVDEPGPSTPSPQTGFILRLPGVRLNLIDHIEVGFDFPVVLNPDTERGRIPVAAPPADDPDRTASADFDVPTADLFLKYSFIGDKKSKMRAAIGFEGKLGLGNSPDKKAFDSIENLRNPFMTQYETQLRPFVALAFSRKSFSPQLSAGVTLAKDANLPDGLTDAAGNPVPTSDLWVDWAVALPFYNSFTSVAFVVGADGRHLLSGLSTALDDRINANAGVMFGGSSAAEFGFVARVPLFSDSYRQFETFSIRFVYSYNLAELSFRKKKEEKKDATPATTPASTPASGPASEPAPAPAPAP
jgi:hypothetical protein